MVVARSPAAQVAFILLWWTAVIQTLSILSLWFFVTRGAYEFLYPLALGGGILGLVALPLTIAALRAAKRADMFRAGTLAMVGGLVAVFSVTGIVAALFALFSPEGRGATKGTDGGVMAGP